MKFLVVVDMQNDFISGALGTKEAEDIVANVVEKINGFDGKIIVTQDTHSEDYLNTQEGRNLPVKHCVKGTWGWEIDKRVSEALNRKPGGTITEVTKHSFGSLPLGEYLKDNWEQHKDSESVEFVGLCTDICVISNVFITKAALPEIPIFVDANCCAGVTPESHQTALAAMRACQITVL